MRSVMARDGFGVWAFWMLWHKGTRCSGLTWDCFSSLDNQHAKTSGLAAPPYKPWLLSRGSDGHNNIPLLPLPAAGCFRRHAGRYPERSSEGRISALGFGMRMHAGGATKAAW